MVFLVSTKGIFHRTLHPLTVLNIKLNILNNAGWYLPKVLLVTLCTTDGKPHSTEYFPQYIQIVSLAILMASPIPILY